MQYAKLPAAQCAVPRRRLYTRSHQSLSPVAHSCATMPEIASIARRPFMISFVFISFASSASLGMRPSGSKPRSPMTWSSLSSHSVGDHSLTQGLKGDPTYLVVTEDNKIETFGINAVCTHLGCVVPWNVPEKKFKCPCHGSQYDKNGRVIRGPAPLSLAHAEVDGDSDNVVFTPWTETDFRTGLQPWWKWAPRWRRFRRDKV